MGSYWAYYELGWGGWWFWDPVENASFMPWLAGTALLHSAVVMEKRSALRVWTMLLAILTFSLSLLGTFLVRSGVLTSVHAFATDPTRGVFILLILCAFIGGSLACSPGVPGAEAGRAVRPDLARGRAGAQQPVPDHRLRHRFHRHALSAGARGITGDKISVGAPFFNLTFAPLFVPLLIAVPFGPLLAWKRGDLLGAAQRLIAAGVAGDRGCRAVGMDARRQYFAPLAIGLAVFVIFGALSDLAERINLFRASLARCRSAARRGCPLGLGHGLRPRRPRSGPDRHRLRNHLEQRIHRLDEAERRGAGRRLQSDFRRHDAAAAIQLS